MKPLNLLPRSHLNRQIRFRGLIETAESVSAVSLKPRKQTISNEYLEFLGELEAICETAFARESEP
jgi:hypothetical protein